MSLTLVLGGTRSGKSRRAEQLAEASGRAVRYIATADASEPEMANRLRAHIARRPPSWETVEVGERLGTALADLAGACALLDGLGSWIATALHRAGAFAPAASEEIGVGVREQVMAEIDRVISIAKGPEPVIVVAEEAGQGVHPADRGSRLWLDLLGEATQRLADAAERVELVVAGRPIVLACAAPGDGWESLRRHGDTEVLPDGADHAVNVLAGGPPDWLRDALHAALELDAGRYPDERDACAALATLHGRHPSEIIPTNGAAEALWLLAPALRPTLAVCVHPGFTETEYALRANGVPVIRVLRDPERGFALDPSAVPAGADLVVVGNPASPCGTLAPAASLLALRRPGRTVVVDEAFMSLVPGEPGTLVGERLEDVVVVRSLTKALAVPGLRAGYAVAARPLAKRLRATRTPWSANALALAALAAAARRPEGLASAAARAQDEREDLERRLAALAGVRTWPSAVNFCLVEVADGPAVVAALRSRSIAVRPAASFPGLGPGHLRLTARGPVENERLVAVLEEALAAR